MLYSVEPLEEDEDGEDEEAEEENIHMSTSGNPGINRPISKPNQRAGKLATKRIPWTENERAAVKRHCEKYFFLTDFQANMN